MIETITYLANARTMTPRKFVTWIPENKTAPILITVSLALSKFVWKGKENDKISKTPNHNNSAKTYSFLTESKISDYVGTEFNANSTCHHQIDQRYCVQCYWPPVHKPD